LNYSCNLPDVLLLNKNKCIKYILKCYNDDIQFQLIDYTSNRGGVSVLTNKAEITVSSLIIQKAKVEDGGLYSCKTNNVEPATIKVHVLTGKFI
jgi:hypothetical protein